MDIDSDNEDYPFQGNSNSSVIASSGTEYIHHEAESPYRVHTTPTVDSSHISRQPNHIPRACWLCEYHGNRTTNEVVRFIMDGIPHMSMKSLVEQSKYLLDQVDAGSDATTGEIQTHIMEHMLHPRVKLALQMQEMSRMQKEVSKCCISADSETGEKTINPQAMRVYLTLCSQISGVYKLGEDKLMYNQGSMDK